MGDCWNFKRLLKLAGTESKVAFAASRNILLCCSLSIEGLRIQLGLFSNAKKYICPTFFYWPLRIHPAESPIPFPLLFHINAQSLPLQSLERH